MFTIDFFYDALRQAQGPCKVGEPAEPTQKSPNTYNLTPKTCK